MSQKFDLLTLPQVSLCRTKAASIRSKRLRPVYDCDPVLVYLAHALNLELVHQRLEFLARQYNFN